MAVFGGQRGKLPALVIIILAVCVSAGVGVVAFTKMKGGKKHGKAAVKEVELTPWKFEEFVVNLADKAESHYLKVSLVLEVDAKGGLESEGEGANVNEARARDAIISVLTRKTYPELLSAHGREGLKAELRSALNERLDELSVVNIYFTSFAMQ